MTMELTQSGEVLIYQSEDGSVQTEVKLIEDTVWLTQRQTGELFGTTPENVLMHLKNIFENKELEESSTSKDFLVVRQEGKRQVKRELKHYNLDAIISVGYRVNSKKGTQFRIWATQRLKEYLVQGYTLNQTRFDKNADELEQALTLIRKTAQSPTLTAEAGSGLVEIVSRYTQTFLWLQRYDEGMLTEPKGHDGGKLLSENKAMDSLMVLKQSLIERGEATDLNAWR